jgi:hypothetical protein
MILFKTDRIKQEFLKLQTLNPNLYKLIGIIGFFCEEELHKDITLTEVFRTQEEQKALYAQTPPERRPAFSPHMYWRAVDIRSFNFTQAEIARILALANCFRYVQGKPVALCHSVTGNAMHLHFQYAAQEAPAKAS